MRLDRGASHGKPEVQELVMGHFGSKSVFLLTPGKLFSIGSKLALKLGMKFLLQISI